MDRKKLLIGLLSIGVVSATAISASASKLDTHINKEDVKFIESIDQASEKPGLNFGLTAKESQNLAKKEGLEYAEEINIEGHFETFDLTNPEEAKALAEKKGLEYAKEINIEGHFETFDLTNPEVAKALAATEGLHYLEEVNMEGSLENSFPFDLTDGK